MPKSIYVDEKKKGRPAGRTFGTPVPVRLTPEQLAAVDVWRGVQADDPSRSEALRRLVELGLSVKPKGRRSAL